MEHIEDIAVLNTDIKTKNFMNNIMSPLFEKIIVLNKENQLFEETCD